jgi:RimJ/RimL family protein N-acetyltransferase
LVLRMPTDDDLMQMVEVARRGIHDPGVMPFYVPWTDHPSPDFERNFLAYHWGARASCSSTRWDLSFAVEHDGQVIGSQSLHGVDFPTLRTAESGSWLGQAFQGQGLGTEMRLAVLHLAFEVMQAERVTSGAFLDNPASQAVSRKCGYEPNGMAWADNRGVAREQVRFLLTRERWLETCTDLPVTITGAEPVLEQIGLVSIVTEGSS